MVPPAGFGVGITPAASAKIRVRIKRSLNPGSIAFRARVTVTGMGTEQEAALEVLREVWRGRGQSAADLDDVGRERSCKRMTDAGVGFADFAAEAAAAGEHGDLAAAWRARLTREGKLKGSGVSVRDLVLGQAEPR